MPNLQQYKQLNAGLLLKLYVTANAFILNGKELITKVIQELN